MATLFPTTSASSEAYTLWARRPGRRLWRRSAVGVRTREEARHLRAFIHDRPLLATDFYVQMPGDPTPEPAR